MRTFFHPFKTVSVSLPFLLSAAFLQGTEYLPWAGNLFEFEWRNSCLYQHYSRIAVDEQLKKHTGDDLFVDSSLSLALPSLALEIEAIVAGTRAQHGNVDCIKATGRYILTDDVAGDFLGTAVGLSLTKAFWPALKDLASFHHGLGEAELFFSLGKETARGVDWVSRWFGTGGIGVAERGSPWLHFDFEYSSKFKERHELTVFCDSLWGTGTKTLKPSRFRGYGSIDHRSVDLGIRYFYLIEFVGSVGCEYSYRVYAFNFPACAHRLTLQFLYTFGL